MNEVRRARRLIGRLVTAHLLIAEEASRGHKIHVPKVIETEALAENKWTKQKDTTD